MLLAASCAGTRSVARCQEPCPARDSLVRISPNEYRDLQRRVDERYVVVLRREYDSLLRKTQSLKELCDILVKKIPNEMKLVNRTEDQSTTDK